MVVGGGVRSPARLGINDQRGDRAQGGAGGPVERRLLVPVALAAPAPAFTTLPAELVRREVLAHLAARDLAAGELAQVTGAGMPSNQQAPALQWPGARQGGLPRLRTAPPLPLPSLNTSAPLHPCPPACLPACSCLRLPPAQLAGNRRALGIAPPGAPPPPGSAAGGGGRAAGLVGGAQLAGAAARGVHGADLPSRSVQQRTR
jgi:hypothetical protein